MGGILSSSAGANHSGRRDIAGDWFLFGRFSWMFLVALLYSFVSLMKFTQFVADQKKKKKEMCSPMWSTSRPNCRKNQLAKKARCSHLNQLVSNLLSKGTWVIKVSPHPPLAAGKICRSRSNLGLMFLGNGSDFCFARFICWIVVGRFHGDGCYTIFIDWCARLYLYFVSLN